MVDPAPYRRMLGDFDGVVGDDDLGHFVGLAITGTFAICLTRDMSAR